jgi:WD40 repeat protein
MDYTTKLWSTSRSTVIGKDAGPTSLFTSMQHENIGVKMALGRDRNLMAIAGNSYNNLIIWDLDKLSAVKQVLRQPRRFESCSFLYDGTLVTLEGVGGQTHIRLWQGIDFTSGGSVPCADAKWMRTSAETSLVALGLPKSVQILDPQVPEDSHYLTPSSGSPSDVAFSRSGPVVILGTDAGEISFWDAETGQQTGESIQHGDQEILALASSSDDKLFASSSADGTVKLWDVASRTESATLPSFPERTMAIDFSPDGEYLVTAGGEVDLNDEARRFYVAKVRLWDASTLELLAEFGGHLDCVMNAQFSHDSRLLATAGRDGKAHVWEVQHLIDYGAETSADSNQ